MMDERTKNLIDECRRQEESCLYTSASLFEWLKSMRLWKLAFVVVPITAGAIATWPLVAAKPGLELLTGFCALVAGVAPAIYKALNFDVSLDQIAKHANEFKTLESRFRQAAQITALGASDELNKEFLNLMERIDTTRSSSLTAPERFFEKARQKIKSGHYDFEVDNLPQPAQGAVAQRIAPRAPNA